MNLTEENSERSRGFNVIASFLLGTMNMLIKGLNRTEYNIL